MTLEGLQKQLSTHPTGGILCQFGELSAFIRGHDQYKSQKGTDREIWLELWDGDCIPGVRVNESFYLDKPRVSVIGGIQRRTFKEVFGGNKGFFLEDGTVHRFLFNYEGNNPRDYRISEWPEKDEALWCNIINSANALVDDDFSADLRHTGDARTTFENWRMDLRVWALKLPNIISTFLPKVESYCLRLAGIIHCFWKLHNGEKPGPTLDVTDVERGIAAIEFYMSNAVQAMYGLHNKETKSSQIDNHQDQEVDMLIKALTVAENKLDNGMITTGEFTSIYNSVNADREKELSPRKMGELIKKHKLTKSTNRERANNLQGICLVWDEKGESFIRNNMQP